MESAPFRLEAEHVKHAAPDLRLLMAVRGLSAKDVSQRSGLHKSRVSRILNGHETLTDATRKRIERAIFADLLADVESTEASNAA